MRRRGRNKSAAAEALLENNDTAKTIYQYFASNPDCNAKKCASDLGFQISRVYNNINKLYNACLLTSREEKHSGHKTAYYSASGMSSSIKKEDVTRSTYQTQRMAKKNIIDDYNKECERDERFRKFLERGPIDEHDTNLAKPDFRYKINGVECVPSGEVIAIAGKPGVGKTTALAILIGVLIGNKAFGEISCVTPCKHVLWVDTEKGTYSCINRIKTLKKVAGFGDDSKLQENGVDFYSIRDVSKDDRLYFVKELAKMKEYDVIVIDGIFDLTTDPDKDYTTVIDFLIRLASDKNSVFAVLHTNKQAEDDNMRYALGTELQRICTTRFTIKIEKENLHAIIHDKSNDTEYAQKVLFQVDETGVVPFGLHSTDKKQEINKDFKKDFEKILAGGIIMTYTELLKEIVNTCHIKENMAKKRISKGCKDGYLLHGSGGYWLKTDEV